MSGQTFVQTRAPAKPTLTPVPYGAIAHGVLQRCTATTECEDCRKKREGMLQRAAVNNSPTYEVPPVVHEVLRSPGQPLDTATRAFMEPRFGHNFSRTRVQNVSKSTQPKLTINRPGDIYEQEADRVSEQVIRMPESALLNGPASHPADDFSQVRVHTDRKAIESARAINALAYTVGRHIVFGAEQYAPETTQGRRLLAHELTHVRQQATSSETKIQAFTAELGEGNRVFVRPEKGDVDADLDRILCSGIQDRRIAGREKIDITECLPKGTVKAMTLGPYICGQFVRLALAGESGPIDNKLLASDMTPVLWQDLLNRGYRVASFAAVDKEGKVTPAKTRSPISWKQLNPRMGDLVFMVGGIRLNKGAKEPNPNGDNFTVNWDHVGFFLVRSRRGFDFHLAKDGDENPVGVYHTGMSLKPEEGLTPGAYVKGLETFIAYLTPQTVGMGDVKLVESRQGVDVVKNAQPLQRYPADKSQNRSSGVPPIVEDVLLSSGEPLDATVRAYMEPRFGRDFSAVRIHTDTKAAESARVVNALAYTVGQDVVFGAGQFAPETFTGKALIAHELSHTLQQSREPQPSLASLRIDLADSPQELQATVMAHKIMSQPNPQVLESAMHSSSARLQRQGMGELRVAEGLSEERAREEQARGRSTDPMNMAGHILTDSDIAQATRAAPGAVSPTRITPGIRGARFVLHDTAALVGASRIGEHQQHGRRSSGEGAGAWVPRDTPAAMAHQPFFGPRRPAATQFERGQDIMVKATRESSYRAVWMATSQTQREAILDNVLSAQGSPAAEATTERSTAIRELAATSGDVHSVGAWAVEDICSAVADRGAAALASSPPSAPNLENACQQLAPLLRARAARVGSTVNVEIVQTGGSNCRTTGSLTPLQPYTANQYTNVMQLYLRAALEARFFPEITTHFLLDRGVGDHCDPRCFNLTLLYQTIATTLGHRRGSTYGITPSYGTTNTANVWWNNQVCGGAHP